MIALSACLAGDVQRELAYGNMENALNIRSMIEPALVINNTKKLDSIDFYEAAYYDQTVNANGIVETNLAENITTLKTTVWDKFNVDAPRNDIGNNSKEGKSKKRLIGIFGLQFCDRLTPIACLLIFTQFIKLKVNIPHIGRAIVAPCP